MKPDSPMTRLRRQNDSLLAPDGLPQIPSSSELTAIAALWKRTQRTFVARFDGVSMRPTIEPLQPVTVHCGPTPAVNDVVLAVSASAVVVHRLVWRSKRGDWVLTRGDGRTVPDLPVDARDIAGVVEAPPYAARRSQQIALRIVVISAAFGRTAALIAIRTLQVVWRACNAGGETM